MAGFPDFSRKGVIRPSGADRRFRNPPERSLCPVIDGSRTGSNCEVCLQLVASSTSGENSFWREPLMRFAAIVTIALAFIVEFPVHAGEADQEKWIGFSLLTTKQVLLAAPLA
jgi:hypothetical protein